ncbi:helix-turn-helix domain-containing protein [Sphingorhabdus sp. SMR4y]|uniref:helix-turn-helix domain-containing protein n=1 Tax=Sphingorhabdus sp. SMR4y TaxID=2584094 RepID=UPI000B5CCBBC|nr:helix-turn-helix transcriptional regulator [Sphingorhabdus sp. SMR4y]ASK89877.1 bacterial regulatory protein, luxR family [Sphingorhabdus sp. SMR4y]
MALSNIDRLNDGQRDCLRLVLAHLNSKEIARELGISPHTVDQRLRTAMRILNVPSRFEAARKFAAEDQQQAYQPLIYQASRVEPAGEIGEQEPSSRTSQDRKAGATDDCADAKSGSVVQASEPFEVSYRSLPLPRFRGEENRLAVVARLGWILAIAIGGALSFGGLVAGLEALSRLKG